MSETRAQRERQLLETLSTLEVDVVGIVPVSGIADSRLHDQVLGLLPGAKSVVALASEIYPEILDHSFPLKEMGEASPRDMLVPHMDYLNNRLTKSAYDLSRTIRRQGLKALPMPAANYPTDQRFLFSVLSYKHAAEAAGLGSIGWHSLVMSAQFGPRLRLACVLTEAELPPSSQAGDSLCDGCGQCIKACPAHALQEPNKGEAYSINKFACSVFRAGAGPCSECMRVCPIGR